MRWAESVPGLFRLVSGLSSHDLLSFEPKFKTKSKAGMVCLYLYLKLVNGCLQVSEIGKK